MFGFRYKLTIKSKLMILLLTVSLGSIMLISFIALLKTRDLIQKVVANELVNLRSSKAHELHLYFDTTHSFVQMLCEDPTIVNAMVEFNNAFKKLEQQEIPTNWNKAIKTYYQKEFFPRLSEQIFGTPHFEVYRPLSQASQYLQYHYIVRNSHPLGEKDKLINAGDESEYTKVHLQHHNFFDRLVDQFHYYDLYLINFDTGDVVYSVDKETDFGTNLDKGPYRYSNLADLLRKVRKNPHREGVQMVDFEFYHPSYAAPEAFIGGPIYQGTRIVGILVLELPVKEIDNILSNNQNWKHDGLGETGEVFLVGSDLRMRSTSRFLIEDFEEYKTRLRATKTSPKTISSIAKHETSILLQEVDTESVREALKGKEGIKIVEDYRGIKALSSYAPLAIEGFDWAIIAEMETQEAYQSLQVLEVYILMGTVIIILLVTWIANLGTNRFLRPIKLMVEEIHEADLQQEDFQLQIDTHDELNELVQAINKMALKLGQQTKLVRKEELEIKSLLLNILPSRVAERFKKGEEQIAENIEQATVVFVNLIGFNELQTSISEAAKMLNELIHFFEQVARKHDVEPFKIIGEQYVVVCGVNKLHLDHSKRIADFALEILKNLEGFNQKYHTALNLKIGVHRGPLKAGIVSNKEEQMLTYNLWGETMNIANYLNQKAPPNTILVSETVYDSLHGLYYFEQEQVLELEDQGKLETWVLRG